MQYLVEVFNHPRFVFAWDSQRSFRKKLYPEYKKKVVQIDLKLLEILETGIPQFREVRFKILPKLGFKNSWLQSGIEADDIIAIFIKKYWERLDKIVIVSGDTDLYQLLQPVVSIFNPKDKTIYTENDFVKEKKINPDKWALVKAIGGCNSDNIKGVRGVAELSVIKWMRGELKGKKAEDIEKFDFSTNLVLTKLPFFLTKPITMIEDSFNPKSFEGLCLDYGLSSLLKKENYQKWMEILK